MKVQAICEDCKAAFEHYPSKQGRFCSRVCSGRAGTAARAKRMAETFAVRFWKRVKKTRRCWEWTGPVGQRHGYGNLKRNGLNVLAHRVAWSLTYGDPKDALVLHECDNRRCVRPSHLFLGTHQDNSDDKIAKKRGRYRPRCKLTAEAVKLLRSFKGRERQIDTAKRFGIHRSHVSRILRGAAWKEH